ncbi:MAG: MFS transporter [Saprospiraceae bacterium]|nr:MFS transporter [Saprospiraceae bacterium]
MKQINARQVFFAACLGMLLFGIVMITLGSTLPELITRYKLTDIQAGSMFSILPLGILAGSLIFGPVADRYGYRGLLISNALIILLGFESIAYGNQPTLLMLSVFMIGLGGGVLNGATNALVADISDQTKGAHLSILGVFYGLGAMTMPILINILKNHLSPQQIISWIGWAIVLVVLVFVSIRFPQPKLATGFSLSQALPLIKSKSLLLAGFFLFFSSGNEGLSNNWLSTFIENHKGLNREQALFALSALVLSLTVARLILGKALKVYSSSRVFMLSLILQFIGVCFLYGGTGYIVLVTGAILLGMGMAAGFPIMLGYVAELFVQWSGTAFSIALALALTGNMLINYIMGFLIQGKGIGTLLFAQWICIVSMFLLLVAFLRINQNKLKN